MGLAGGHYPWTMLTAMLLAASIALSPARSTVDEPPNAPMAAIGSDLLAGIGGEVPVFGTPGVLAVWGPDATVVITASGDRDARVPLAARSVMGKGRVVCFAHTGYVGATPPGPATELLVRSVQWAARQDGPLRVGIIGSDGRDTLAAALGPGAVVASLSSEWHDSLNGLSCLVVSGWRLNDGDLAVLKAFIEAGGGVVAGQTAWAWTIPPGKSLIDNPLNRLMAPAGIAWTGGYSGKTSQKGLALDAGPAELNASKALDFLLAEPKDASRRDVASLSLTAAARMLPPSDDLLRPRLATLLEARRDGVSPSEKTPLRVRDAAARALLAFEVADLASNPSPKAHRAASSFPGSVASDASVVAVTRAINTGVGGWHSTGAYAAPGSPITVQLGQGVNPTGMRVRIGCHEDAIWHLREWKRVPEVAMEVDLRLGATTVTSPFGGLVYISVAPDAKARTVDVTIEGAHEAPFFERGVTTNEAWMKRRQAPAPWAELASSKVILSVPSEHVRTLDDPEALLAFWDRIMDAMADLAGIDRARPRPERYVADVQISAGYMHAGYPIMTHLDAAADMTSLERMRTGPWGLLHEMGHNHQSGLWTFEGTGEVTCNVFAMYVLETVCERPWIEGHDGMKDRGRKIAGHIAKGRSFEQWKSDPFLALQMYAQLVEGFGWQPFKDVFADYRLIPKDKQPRTEQQKRDEWMLRMSNRLQRDLGPFFEAWGVPVSDQARLQARAWPDWMPPEMAAAK